MQLKKEEKPRVLIVDDEVYILDAMRRRLQEKFEVETAMNAIRAVQKLELEGPFNVVVSDMRMPGMDGVEFFSYLSAKHSNVKRIMLTGCREQEVAKRAVNEGQVFRFISKPCAGEDLTDALLAALEEQRIEKAEKDLLQHTLGGCVRVLTDLLSLTDPVSFACSKELRSYVRKTARALELPDPWELEMAAMLCHLGNVAIPPHVLKKQRTNGELSEAEKIVLERIPELGCNLLNHIPRLERVAKIVYYQNKQFDGGGFPNDEVKGREIPVGARLIKILQDYQQIRPTKNTMHGAFRELLLRAGFYDKPLLESVYRVFRGEELHKKSKEPPAIVRIPISELKPGYILKSDIEALNGSLLVSVNTPVSQVLIERLHNFKTFVGIKEPIFAIEPDSEG